MEPLVRSLGPRLFGLDPDPRAVDRILTVMAHNDP